MSYRNKLLSLHSHKYLFPYIFMVHTNLYGKVKKLHLDLENLFP